MNRILLSTIFLLISFSVWSQLVITNDETPEQLILNSFLGENLSISNIKFNRSTAAAGFIRDQMAKFSNGIAALSSEQGLILSTGNVFRAIGPNDIGSANMVTATPTSGDPDLAMITGAQVSNIGCVEFDFIPNGDTVLFEYVFASEEYPEFVNSIFNDTFGLFLSGPGISGTFTNNAINIAIIPGTSQAVSINNLNNGNLNNGPCTNCQYYISNGTGLTPLINSEMQYDGRSSIFTASGTVIPGSTYHLKFVIANIGAYDNLYDSAMFLVEGSLRSATLNTQNFQTEAVKIFPNPATDFISIRLTDNISNVNIYDLQGRILMNIKTQGSDMNIDTTALPRGTYIVEFRSTNNEIIRQKLIKK